MKELYLICTTLWLVSVANFFRTEVIPLPSIDKWDLFTIAVIFLSLIAGEYHYYKHRVK